MAEHAPPPRTDTATGTLTMGQVLPLRPAVDLTKHSPAAIPAPPADPPAVPAQAHDPANAPQPLEGTVYQHGVKVLPPDPLGDTPLRPAWMTTPEGRRAYRIFLWRRTVRAGRRWVRRQRTPHGHHRQIKRGFVRIHAWVIGVEGIQVHAARAKVQDSGRLYKAAARRNNLTPDFLSARKAKTSKAAEDAKKKAEADYEAYKKRRKDLGKLRWMRGSIAYGPHIGLSAAALATLDTPGLLMSALLSLIVTGALGRHTDAAHDWTLERRAINDGDVLTEPFVHAALVQAHIYKEDQQLSAITPVKIAPGAWDFTFDLPPAVTVRHIVARIDEFASALGCKAPQISIEKGDREGRVHLYVCERLPFTGKPKAGPLLDRDKPTNFAGDIPWGVTVRGEQISLCLVERTILLGGIPGSGKTSGADSLLLYAALDPYVSLWLADGKNGTGIQFYEEIAEEYLAGPDAEAFIRMLDKLIEQEMRFRFDFLTSIGEEKVTPELARKHKELRWLLFHCDEIMHYVLDPEHKKTVDRRLITLISQARGAGIIISIATQKPSSDVINTLWRDLLWGAAAYCCTTPEMSDTILGRGTASTGANAKNIAREMRGVHWLKAEGEKPCLVHSHFYTTAHRRALVKLGLEWRRAAGTLPERRTPLAERVARYGEDGRKLSALLGAFTQEGAAWLPSSLLLEYLAKEDRATTERALGQLVPRTKEEAADRRDWSGKQRVSGYPLEAAERAAQALVDTAGTPNES